MSGHNMSGDMYARYVLGKLPGGKILFRFYIRMVAEQTAAYQKQMWLSQLQVTNPQAYQVTLRFISRDHPHPSSSFKQFLSAVCSFPGARARRGDFGKRVFSSCTRLFKTQFLHQSFFKIQFLHQSLKMQMSLHHFLQAFSNKRTCYSSTIIA